MTPSHLTLSDLERSKSRSLRFQSFVSCKRAEHRNIGKLPFPVQSKHSTLCSTYNDIVHVHQWLEIYMYKVLYIEYENLFPPWSVVFVLLAVGCQNGIRRDRPDGGHRAILRRAPGCHEAPVDWQWGARVLRSLQWIPAEWLCKIVSIYGATCSAVWVYTSTANELCMAVITVTLSRNVCCFLPVGGVRRRHCQWIRQRSKVI